MPKFTTVTHSLLDLTGIGPSLEQDLKARGFDSTEDLLALPIVPMARDLEQINGISYEMVVTTLFPEAMILRLPGMTAQVASEFCKKGVRSYERVEWISAGSLSSWASAVGFDASPEQVCAWQLDAARRVGTGSLTVDVRDGSGNPIGGASVAVQNPFDSGYYDVVEWETGANGRALCEYLRPGFGTFVVTASGCAPKPMRAFIEPGYKRMRVDLAVGDPAAPVVDEIVDGIRLPNEGVPIKRLMVSPSDLDTTQVFFVSDDADPARLTALQWQQFGGWIHHRSMDVPKSSLPSPAPVGTVLQRDPAGGFVTLEMSWIEWRNAARTSGGAP